MNCKIMMLQVITAAALLMLSLQSPVFCCFSVGVIGPLLFVEFLYFYGCSNIQHILHSVVPTVSLLLKPVGFSLLCDNYE